MYKVKIFEEGLKFSEDLEDKINSFLVGKNIISIKVAGTRTLSVVVIYEE